MKKLFLFAIVLITLSVAVFPSDVMESAKNALTLLYETVIPSLFPFMVCSNLIISLGGGEILGKLLKNIMMPLFRINGAGSIALIMGLLSGYPCGGAVACSLYQSGVISKNDAHRLLSFVNNSGPLFIIGAVGIGIYQNTKIGVLLYISHVLSALTVGFLGRLFSSSKSNSSPILQSSKISVSSVIPESVKSIMNLSGYIVFFAVIYRLCEKCGITLFFEKSLCSLKMPTDIAKLLPRGIIEMTTALKNTRATNLCAVSAIIALGGISILFQTMSLTKSASLSIKPYIIGKIFQGGFSAFFMALLLRISPVEVSVLSTLTKEKLLAYPPYFVAFSTSVFCFIYFFTLLSSPQDGKSACPEKQSFARTRS